MPKISYISKRLGRKKLALVVKANEIIDEYKRMGFDLTLRQLYYQFVARDLIPNSQRSYKQLGDAISDGRLLGLIDWYAIVDRTRNLRALAHWTTPSDILHSCANQYRLDRWTNQDNYVEVWVEKDALVGVIAPVCNEFDIPFFACRGYTSQSEIWIAGQRLRAAKAAGKTCFVLHLGDHDPSGIDMTRDIEARLDMFSHYEARPEVRRLALNFDQVEEYDPPPNPAKLTDSRADGYIAEYGRSSWELDALSPEVISNLIRDEVDDLIDQDAWDEVEEREDEHKRALALLADRWEEAVEYLEEND